MEQKNSRILIIGIDGGTWDVLGIACDKGLMPQLDRFRQRGAWGTLRSTIPPITPAAWVAFMTGKNPGRHGVLGFQEYDSRTNKPQLTSSRSIRTETLWQKLARHDKRVIVVGVPMTYPPLEVNGTLVSGFDTPSIENQFTCPASFKEEILRQIPDFTFERLYRKKHHRDSSTFEEFLKWLRRQAYQNVETFRLAMKKHDWDLGMVLLRSFDELLHVFWKLLDYNYETSANPQNRLIPSYFQDLDGVIGELLGIAEQNGASVVLISDHGGQAKRGNIYPNRILRDLGYVHQAPGWKLFFQKISKKWRRRRPRNHPLGKLLEPNTLARQIDLKATSAYITEINLYADLHVQVKGRQETGIVAPQEADSLIDEIASALRDSKDSDGELLFQMVERPQNIYNLDQHKTHLPDLIIAAREGYTMRGHVTGTEWITHDPEQSLVGTHSLNGMMGFLGAEFKSGFNSNAEIVDIAPTVLAAMNLPVTDDMDGRVLEEVFRQPRQFTRETIRWHDQADQHVYSQDEQEEITSRLSDLGYL